LDNDEEIWVKEGEIDRGRTIKTTLRKGKKTIEVWDRCAESIRFRTKKDIDEYRMYMEKQKEELDNRVELWSSKIYNRNISGDKKDKR